jgi:hypothetical protein
MVPITATSAWQALFRCHQAHPCYLRSETSDERNRDHGNLPRVSTCRPTHYRFSTRGSGTSRHAIPEEQGVQNCVLDKW